MIRELSNVELFELCETIPKVQCSLCLLYWNQGIAYCTCGQCLIDSESRRKFNKLETGCTLVLVMAKPKNKKSTMWLGLRGRDAARKLILRVNILQVFTIDSSGIQFIVNHNSQSDGQNKSAMLQKKTIHIVSLQRKRKDTNKLKSLLLQNNTGYGIPLQPPRGGTSLNGIGNELIRNF